MNYRDKPKNFTDDWGEAAVEAGFLQLPNDFIRNIGTLDLKPSTALVMIAVMSYGEHRQATARQIGKDLGLAIGTVRGAFRELQSKKVLHRDFQIGEANRFTWGGLKQAVRKYAKNRQTHIRERDRGVYEFDVSGGRNPYTNKESSNKKYKKEGYGYAQLQKAKDDLIKKLSR